jgi:hypothetical protein
VLNRVFTPHRRLGPTRGFKARAGARFSCAGQAFLPNLRCGFSDHPEHPALAQARPVSPVVISRDALTAGLSAK